MRGHQNFLLFKSAMLGVLCVMLLCSAAFSSSYKFSVFNNSGSKITKIPLCRKMERPGDFSTSARALPLAPQRHWSGMQVLKVRTASNDKAASADGLESGLVVFDFCEKGAGLGIRLACLCLACRPAFLHGCGPSLLAKQKPRRSRNRRGHARLPREALGGQKGLLGCVRGHPAEDVEDEDSPV